MPCNCVPIIINTPKTCEECLQLVSLRFTCDEGPDPCGDTLVVDMATHNDVSACDCGTVVYSIVSYDTDAFSSVVITPDGEITATTTDTFVDKEEYLITYKVDCPCNILSGTANVYVCKKNLCAGVTCPDGQFCNPCDGTCDPSNSDLDVDDGGVTANSSGGTGFA